MLPEKPYLRQIGLLEVGKFAKKPYFSQFYRRSKRAAPKDEDTIGWARYYFMGPNIAPIYGNLASRAGDTSPCAISIRRLTAFSILSRDAVREDVAARRACLVCELC